MFPSAFFEKQKCSLQNTAMGSDSSWAQSYPWPGTARDSELQAALEVPALDPSLRMDKDDELNSCPWHRAARQEKFHTQSSAGEEKEIGWIPLIF